LSSAVAIFLAKWEEYMSRKIIFSLMLLLLSGGFLFAGGEAEETSAAVDYTDPAVLRNLIENSTEQYTLIDVRTPAEYDSGHIPTSVNIPVNIIRAAAPDTPKDSLIIVYCRSGNRSAAAATELEKLGYTQVIDFGGINRWPYEVE
jgi:rhodanese-related sulfurtransferase